MQSLYTDYAAGVFDAQTPPCLSLYQPTHRGHPDNNQDQIRYRNLVKELENSLRSQYSIKDVTPLLAPFRKLAEDFNFWNHTGDGLAVLSAAGMFKVYRLQRPVAELAVVADSFHLKPLLRILQSADRYHVLTLSQQEAKLFEGNRDKLDPVVLLPEVVEALDAVMENEEDKPRAQTWTFGPSSATAGFRHGHTGGTDLTDQQTERFFRAVDRTILEHYSRPSGLPLLLVTLPEHQARFRRISHNAMLIEDGINTHPEGLQAKELRKRSWEVLEPHYLARLAGLVEMYGVAQSRELGSSDLSQAMRAAAAGRVMTLLIEANRHIPGHVDVATGGIEYDTLDNPKADDLLDDLGELVLRTGGQVVVVPAERMPTKTGLAATYRF